MVIVQGIKRNSERGDRKTFLSIEKKKFLSVEIWQLRVMFESHITVSTANQKFCMNHKFKLN